MFQVVVSHPPGGRAFFHQPRRGSSMMNVLSPQSFTEGVFPTQDPQCWTMHWTCHLKKMCQTTSPKWFRIWRFIQEERISGSSFSCRMLLWLVSIQQTNSLHLKIGVLTRKEAGIVFLCHEIFRCSLSVSRGGKLYISWLFFFLICWALTLRPWLPTPVRRDAKPIQLVVVNCHSRVEEMVHLKMTPLEKGDPPFNNHSFSGSSRWTYGSVLRMMNHNENP